MQKTTLLLIAILLAFTASPAQPRTETLEYNISHSYFSCPLGSMILTAQNDGNATALGATVDTSPAVEKAYSLHCVLSSRINGRNTTTPKSASETIIEKRYWRTVDQTWEGSGNAIHAKMYNSRSENPTEALVTHSAGTRDILSALWHLRHLDYRENDVPQAGNIIIQRRITPVNIQGHIRKTVLVNGEPTDVIEVTVTYGNKGNITLTLTDDTERTPLSFSADLPFGKANGRLVKENTPVWQEEKDLMAAFGWDPQKRQVEIKEIPPERDFRKQLRQNNTRPENNGKPKTSPQPAKMREQKNLSAKTTPTPVLPAITTVMPNRTLMEQLIK